MDPVAWPLRSLAGVILLFTLLPQGAMASEQDLRLFHRYSSLSSGLSDWQDWQLYWERLAADKDRDYIELENQSHFGIQDNQLAVGRQFYVRDELQYQAELDLSQNSELFPAYSLLGGMSRKLNKQTVLAIDLRLSHFYKVHPITSVVTEPDSLGINTRLDYYFGNNLIAYSLYYTQMQSPGISEAVSSQSLKYLYVYSGRNNIYLSLSGGEEIDFEPTTTALAISRVDSLALGGSHWLSAHTALVYTMANHQVGSSGFSYNRNELYLGIRRLL